MMKAGCIGVTLVGMILIERDDHNHNESYNHLPIDKSLVLLIALGLVHTGVGFLLFFIGLQGLQAHRIAILCYLDLLTSVAISLFIFGGQMTLTQMTGALLICGATLAGTVNRGNQKNFLIEYNLLPFWEK